MGTTENRVDRRRPVSVGSFIDKRDVIIRCHLYAELRRSGMPSEQADKMARNALRRARKDIYEDLPDVTKADLKSLKVRRSP